MAGVVQGKEGRSLKTSVNAAYYSFLRIPVLVVHYRIFVLTSAINTYHWQGFAQILYDVHVSSY